MPQQIVRAVVARPPLRFIGLFGEPRLPEPQDVLGNVEIGGDLAIVRNVQDFSKCPLLSASPAD
jgi:hypothetical protein